MSKMLLDALLLRALPTSLFSIVVYWLMGLRATAACFSTFLLVLVTFDIAVRG